MAKKVHIHPFDCHLACLNYFCGFGLVVWHLLFWFFFSVRYMSWFYIQRCFGNIFLTSKWLKQFPFFKELWREHLIAIYFIINVTN